jgi:hypothetical protein
MLPLLALLGSLHKITNPVHLYFHGLVYIKCEYPDRLMHAKGIQSCRLQLSASYRSGRRVERKLATHMEMKVPMKKTPDSISAISPRPDLSGG